MLMLLLSVALAQEPAPSEAPELAEIRAVFSEVERLSAVEVSLQQGVLRLRGEAPTVEAKAEAEAIAERVGAAFIDNLIAVEQGEPTSQAQDSDDESIEASLRSVFSQVEELQPVSVAVSSGVVTLSGTVLDSAAREKALELAGAQDGVVYVSDHLEETTDVRTRLRPAIDDAWDKLRGLVAQGPLLLIALVVVALAWLLSRVIGRSERVFRRLSDRPLLRNTLRQVLQVVVLGVGILIALEVLDAVALVGAVVGTAGVFGLALGFAFQDIVENYLAGLLLSVQQPFSKDDMVDISGVKGVVVRLTSRNTLLLTPDGNHIYLPNATVFKSGVTNFSRNPARRFNFQVGVGVDEDLTEVIAVGTKTLREMPGVSDDPAPSVHIGSLGDSSVVMDVYGWVDQRSHSFLAVRTEAIRRIKEAYDAAGFDMPEPIYRVSVSQPAALVPPKRTAPSAETAVDLRAEDTLERQAQRERAKEEGDDLLSDTPRRAG